MLLTLSEDKVTQIHSCLVKSCCLLYILIHTAKLNNNGSIEKINMTLLIKMGCNYIANTKELKKIQSFIQNENFQNTQGAIQHYI